MILARRSPRSGGRGRPRAAVWQLSSPVPAAGEVVVDLDATLIGAHSDKEGATANFKRGYGFHPMMAFVDHGAGGTGEPLAAMLRPGRANASDAADQIAVLDAALAQLPEAVRPRVLVRGDTGSGVKDFLWHIHHLGLSYSVGVYGRQPVLDALAALPRQAWRQALDADGRPRDGAQVAELTRWLPASFVGWPPGMRVIARRERPHPGAQLRITDQHGWRITMFATNTTGGRIAELEVRHRLRARAEDRIRTLKDTGLTNLPLQAFGKNEIWLELARPGLRTADLDPTAGLARSARPHLGTQTITPAPAERGRPRHHQRPPPHPAPESPMALVEAADQRSAKPRRAQLNPTPSPHHQDQENRRSSAGDHPRPHLTPATPTPTTTPKPAHERSRLGPAQVPQFVERLRPTDEPVGSVDQFVAVALLRHR